MLDVGQVFVGAHRVLGFEKKAVGNDPHPLPTHESLASRIPKGAYGYGTVTAWAWFRRFTAPVVK